MIVATQPDPLQPPPGLYPNPTHHQTTKHVICKTLIPTNPYTQLYLLAAHPDFPDLTQADESDAAPALTSFLSMLTGALTPLLLGGSTHTQGNQAPFTWEPMAAGGIVYRYVRQMRGLEDAGGDAGVSHRLPLAAMLASSLLPRLAMHVMNADR